MVWTALFVWYLTRKALVQGLILYDKSGYYLHIFIVRFQRKNNSSISYNIDKSYFCSSPDGYKIRLNTKFLMTHKRFNFSWKSSINNENWFVNIQPVLLKYFEINWYLQFDNIKTWRFYCNQNWIFNTNYLFKVKKQCISYCCNIARCCNCRIKINWLWILNNCMIIIDIIKRIHHKTKRKCRRYHEIIINDDQKRSN